MSKIIFIFLIFILELAAKAEHATGLIIPKDWDKEAQFVSTRSTRMLPWWFDWRNELPQKTHPDIVNQGQCGSCWAFGTTAVLNWNHAIYKGEKIDLSEQEILSCSRKGTCNGGFFAHNYQGSPGHSLESEFPYRAQDLNCRTGLRHETRLKRWSYIGSSNRPPTVEEMKTAIMEHGPIGVTITSNQALQNYRGGVFKGCSQGQTNHIVHIVGWDDMEKVWIMGNSWGKNWGENGYARIPYGCSRIGEIATFVEY